VRQPLSPTASAGERTRWYLGVWYWASRPFTLTASIVPILVGSALAFQEERAVVHLFVLALIASVLVQIGTNLTDEFSDDAIPEARGQKLIAPYKVIALGLLSNRTVKLGAVISFALATGIGLYIVAVAGWPILVIALASLFVAYLYAGGPKPLGTVGLGNPLVFVFMGPVMVMGAHYVHIREITMDAFLVSVPVACLVTAILVANDLRDLEEDRVAGKTTPVTLFGRPFGRLLFTALVVGAFVAAPLLATVGGLGLWLLLSGAALYPAYGSLRKIWGEESRPSFAVAMRHSARLHWWFGVLFAAGLALGRP
jgi:1,4-dihydroxy-2-naphthoate octaprenyltransferase